MKPKLTSEYDGVIKVADVPVHYSVLPDGRRVIINDSDKTGLKEIITPASTGFIKFQDTHGLIRMGMDVQNFPDALAHHMQNKSERNLNTYMPWLIFKALFLFGVIGLLHSRSDRENEGIDFKRTLGDLVAK